MVYENGVFQGYGYITRILETADDRNHYVAGAQMALFEAIEIQRSGDSEDYAFNGVKVVRDKNGNVTSIYVEEGFAGERTELVETEQEIWKAKTEKREDTPVLFYDLGNLQVLGTDAEGKLYGYDEHGRKKQMTFDTESIYAIRDGQAVFEITGGNFHEIVYSTRAKAFINISEKTQIYHLDQDLCRDALVDGYTGLAYVEKAENDHLGQERNNLYVWPIVELKDERGVVFAREKILTGRPGERDSGTDQAYITGTLSGETGIFEKDLNPVYEKNGLVTYYPSNENEYTKINGVFDRDGEYLGERYEDLLDEYNCASYRITEDPVLYSTEPLLHRDGEAWMIPNVWVTGEESLQDPTDKGMTNGQSDLLRRVIPGTYILEELNTPEGYVRSMPVAVCVEEAVDVQKVSVTDEKTKVEIAKVDGTEQYNKAIISSLPEEQETEIVEGKAGYTGKLVENAELALFRAKRVYTSDYTTYPNGYYLTKTEETPARWYTQSDVDNQPILVEARWITSNQPKYFEGIPVGDYILEELQTPSGYLSATKEITVRKTEKLQSFLLMDDHTKLEIYKYEEEKGTKQFLKWPARAELSLYPAVLDASGEVLKENGNYVYNENERIISWKTGDLEQYEAIAGSYEFMYGQYGSSFNQFSWEFEREGRFIEGHAQLENSFCTENNEMVTQLWKLEDGSIVRTTVKQNSTGVHAYPTDTRTFEVEYQFQYQTEVCEKMPEMVSYDFLNGIHRIDRIPAGVYILAETKVPEGYQEAEPQLIIVEETEAVQRYYVKNKKEESDEKTGTLTIEKYDFSDNSKRLSGAWFEAKNLQNEEIYRAVTGIDGKAIFENLAVTGVYENGETGPCIYEIKEILPPDGYQLEPIVWRIRFKEDGEQEKLFYTLNVANKQTEIMISKKDFQMNQLVSGAQLAIYETRLEDGKVVAVGGAIERWVSDGDPHVVVGKLSCGKTYLLVEESAPNGYTIAAPIRFTVSQDGKRLVEITNGMAQVQLQYDEATNEIRSFVVTGREAIEVENILQKDENDMLKVYGTGQGINWKKSLIGTNSVETVYKNKLLAVDEQLIFSDGSHETLRRETFRVEEDSNMVYESSGRYPLYTEYTLFHSNGVRIDKWNVSKDSFVHEIKNEKNQEGKQLFETGKTYYLTETVIFNTGERIKTNRMSIYLPSDDTNAIIEVLNKETDARISKVDLTTGKELPGAKIAIKDSQGTILDEWVSGSQEHLIKGVLVPGETYTLVEQMAADGYAYAEEIEFTMHENGVLEKVTMEDRPTYVEIRKTDMTTGEDLPGAKLKLTDENGETVAQWISGKTPYVIKGCLIAGATYTLTEEIAPDGYVVAESVTFTVSMDGSIDRVTMMDDRIPRSEEPEEPDESEKPDKPKEPEAPKEPEVPMEPEDPAEEGKIGRVLAVYETKLEKSSSIRVFSPEGLESLVLPKTGEEPFINVAFLGLVFSMTGLCWLYWGRRKQNDEKARS